MATPRRTNDDEENVAKPKTQEIVYFAILPTFLTLFECFERSFYIEFVLRK